MPDTTSVHLDRLTVRPLATDTWPAFPDLVGRHNGVFGGCWGTYFHSLSRDPDRTYDSNRDLKCRLVEEVRAHAARVFDCDEAVGWAQYGPPEELPTSTTVRNTRRDCSRHRTTGVAALACERPPELIAEAGGGVAEGYPHNMSKQPAGTMMSSSFLGPPTAKGRRPRCDQKAGGRPFEA